MSFISRISEEDNESPSRIFNNNNRGSRHSSTTNMNYNMESASATKLLKDDSQNQLNKKQSIVVIDKNEVPNTVVRFNNEAEVVELDKTQDETHNEEEIYNDAETRLLNNLREQLYDGVVKGQIDKVETLLDLPYADINMTWYSENLLMCALRAKQEKMAEYLIHRGIDVSYEVDLFEFKERSKTPIRYEFYSCRQMAYDYGLINIVALIDFFHEKTSKKIVKYIGRKLLKTNEIKNREMMRSLKKQRLLENRLIETFIKKDDKQQQLSTSDILQMQQHQNSVGSFKEHEQEKSKTSFDYESENILYDELDTIKPISVMEKSADVKKSESIPATFKEGSFKSASDGMKSSVSSEAMPAIDVQKLLELETKNQIKITDELSQGIYKRLSDQCPNTISATTVPKKKDLSYKGYKIEFCINLVDDLTPRKNGTENSSTNKQSDKLQSTIPLPKRCESVRSQRPKSQLHSRMSMKRENTNNYTSMSFMSKSEYLNLPNVVSKPLDTVQSRPVTSISNRTGGSRSRLMNNNSVIRSMNNGSTSTFTDKSIITTTTTTAVKIKQLQPVKATQNFKDSYLNSLKRSGLVNDYCVPIIRSKLIRGVIAAK